MSTEKMREEFEAFAVKRNAELIAEGHYSNSRFMIRNFHYPIWQASRAAIEVVMPQGSIYSASEAASEADYYFDQGQADGLRKARNAIESLGLKVNEA